MKVQKIVNESQELSNSPLLDELLNFKIETFNLYEAHNGSTVSSNVSKKLKSDGYINVRGTEIHSNEDVAIISKMFRDSRYETFRILYVKGNKIIASEGITCKSPDSSAIIGYVPNITSEVDRVIYYYNHRMEKLKADGYYLVHNHTDDDSLPSDDDYRTTKFFIDNIPGFIAHIIVGDDEYTIFDKESEITKKFTDEPSQTYSDDTVLSDPDVVASIANKYHSSKNTTAILYCVGNGRLASAEILDNKQFKDKDIFNYISNRKREEGSMNCFLYTCDEDICDKASDYIVLNLFTDVLYEETPSYIISMRQKLNLSIDPAYTTLGKEFAKMKRYRVS